MQLPQLPSESPHLVGHGGGHVGELGDELVGPGRHVPLVPRVSVGSLGRPPRLSPGRHRTGEN